MRRRDVMICGSGILSVGLSGCLDSLTSTDEYT